MEPSYSEFQGKIQSALHNISELREQNAEIRVLGDNGDAASWEVDSNTDVVLYLSVKMKNNDENNAIDNGSSEHTTTKKVIHNEIT